MTAVPRVSVLTPVYNGAAHLQACIESVLRQTYPHWEYVIVDNVSKDDTAAIAERYASHDCRIRVVRAAEFVDMWANHNRAIHLMDRGSRYCKFVQADDWLYPECLERMVDRAESYPRVGMVGAYAINVRQVQLDGLLTYSQSVMDGREAIRRQLQRPWTDWIVGGPTSALFRAECVRARAEFFDRTVWHADADAAFRVLLSGDLGFVHQVLTSMGTDDPGVATTFAWRVYSFLPMEGRMVIRYGPVVMNAGEYRQCIRTWLLRYGRWLGEQRIRPSRHRQAEFQEFHRHQIDCMLAEAHNDRETRLILAAYRRVFLRPGAGKAHAA
jgi:glycosyltransferase involved in cell wall biosynthesis